jgi:hypothetical protein
MLDAVVATPNDRASFVSRNVSRMRRLAPHFGILVLYLAFNVAFAIGMTHPAAEPLRVPALLTWFLVDIPLVFILPVKSTVLLGPVRNIVSQPLHIKLMVLAVSAIPFLIFYRLLKPRSRRIAVAGLLWMPLAAVPFWSTLYCLALNFYRTRHLYLPSAGFALVLSTLLIRPMRRKLCALIAMAMVLIIYIPLTTSYVRDWGSVSGMVATVLCRLREQVPSFDGTRLYLMNIPYEQYCSMVGVWDPIDLMMALSPDVAGSVFRQLGIGHTRADEVIWNTFPYRIYILNDDPKTTYGRNQEGRPPVLTPDKLSALDYGRSDLFFFWDSNVRDLKNVTAEIKKMAMEGALHPPFDVYLKSTIREDSSRAEE